MQNRRRGHNGAINESLDKSEDHKLHGENSDSAKEYEEPRASPQFRRWANHIWNLSNNVTNRLRELVGNNRGSNTTRRNCIAEESRRDESNVANGSNGWTTSSGFTEPTNRINENASSRRPHRQNGKSHGRSKSSKAKSRRYGNRLDHVTEDHRMYQVIGNRVESVPLATYPPVLILPRIHRETNVHQIQTGFYRSRHDVLKCRHLHGDDSANAARWYRHYHHADKRWGYEESRNGEDYSCLLERHEIPENLGSLTNEPKTRRAKRKSVGNSHEEMRSQPVDCDTSMSKRLGTRGSDFVVGKNCGVENVQLNSSHCSKPSRHAKHKKVVWDLQLSDITSQDPSSEDPSKAALFAKPSEHSVTLNIEATKSRAYGIADDEVPVKGNNALRDKVPILSINESAAIKNFDSFDSTERSRCMDVEETITNDRQKPSDDIVRWPSETENSFDSLLRNLRARMDTLANVHSVDSAGQSSTELETKKDESSFTKGSCIVASCLAGTYLHPYLENRHNIKVADYSIEANEDARPSFSDRIHDIWRDAGTRVWRSPTRETSPRYDMKSEKDLFSKLSVAGLNQQPIFRQYFTGYNNAVTLTQILEELIDSRSKSNTASAPGVFEESKPPSRFCRKQSRTCLVDIGVQIATVMSNTSSQDPRSNSRHRFFHKQASRAGTKRTVEPRTSKLRIETPRPLQVFSGHSIIPISSVQFMPVVAQALTDPLGFQSPLQREHSVVIDNPVVQERSQTLVMDYCAKYSPTECRVTRESPFAMQGQRLTSSCMKNSNSVGMDRESIDQREHLLSLVLEQEWQRSARVPRQGEKSDSIPVRHRESESTKARSSALAEDTSVTKSSRSWWSKKLSFYKNSKLKVKIASFLKYLTKSDASDKDHTKKHSSNPVTHDTVSAAATNNVAPKPPVRVKRKNLGANRKSSKSIQWESNDKIESFLMTDNRRSMKGTLHRPAGKKPTVSCGTNTRHKKFRKTSSREFGKTASSTRKEHMVRPRAFRVSRQLCTDPFNALKNYAEVTVTSETIQDPKQKSVCSSTTGRLGSTDPLLSPEGNSEPLNNPAEKVKEKFKVTRSLSSKIPLATRLVNTSTVSGRRPSTAPILDNKSRNLSPPNGFRNDLKTAKLFDGISGYQDTGQKMLFKHNRSSLLRANTSMLKKSAFGAPAKSRKRSRDKDVVRQPILNALRSSHAITNAEPQKLLPVNEIQSTRIDLQGKQLECNNDDIKSESLSDLEETKMGNYSELPTEPLCSEHTNEEIVEKEPECEACEDSHKETKGLTNGRKFANCLTPSSKLEPSREKNTNSFHNVSHITKNLESSNDKQQSLKIRGISPSEVTENCFNIDDAKEISFVNIEANKFRHDTSFVSMGGKKTWESPSALRRLKENKTKSEESENLAGRLFGCEDFNSALVRISESKETSYEICHFGSKSLPIDYFFDEDEARISFAREFEISGVESKVNGKKSQSKLVYSTVGKAAKKLFKHSDMHEKKPASWNKEISTIGRSKKIFSSGLVSKVQSPIFQINKSGKVEPKATGMSPKIVPRATYQKSSKKGEGQVRKSKFKKRNGGSKEVSEFITSVLDTVLSRVVEENRKVNSSTISSAKNRQHILLVDSVEPEISRSIYSTVESKIDTKFSPSFPAKPEERPTDSFCQKQADSELKRAQQHPVLTIGSNVLLDVTNEGQTDWERIRLSKKFSTVSEPLPESEVSELCVLSTVTSADDGGEIRVTHTDEDGTLDNSQISHRDNEPRIITRPLKIDTEADCHSTQSINAFEFGEAADRQEKLRSSMFNVHLGTWVEFRKLEGRGCAGWMQENGKLSRAESTSIRVTDDENSSTSSNSRRNVKIDNKVLEEKVKCSLEKGVPLKTITITDPSIIRPSSSSDSSANLTVDEKVQGKDLHHENSLKMLCDYQGMSLGVKSEGQTLQTTRLSHRNPDTCMDTGKETLILEIPSKTRNFGPDVVENVVIIGNRGSRVVEQHDSVLSLKLKKKRLRQRGTLIPRYKSSLVGSPVRNAVPRKQKYGKSTKLTYKTNLVVDNEVK